MIDAEKRREREARYRERHPDRRSQIWKRWSLKKFYGLSVEDVAAMRVEQDERCACCRQPFGDDVHVDHDHATGKVRGLLCSLCNVGIGYFRENAHAMRSAAVYVERGGFAYTSIPPRTVPDLEALARRNTPGRRR